MSCLFFVLFFHIKLYSFSFAISVSPLRSEENFEMCTSDGVIWYIFWVNFVLIPVYFSFSEMITTCIILVDKWAGDDVPPKKLERNFRDRAIWWNDLKNNCPYLLQIFRFQRKQRWIGQWRESAIRLLNKNFTPFRCHFYFSVDLVDLLRGRLRGKSPVRNEEKLKDNICQKYIKMFLSDEATWCIFLVNLVLFLLFIYFSSREKTAALK